MAYRGIFLDKMHPNVVAKLDKLHREAGSTQRTTNIIDKRTPWVRLTSCARSDEKGFPNANAYILYPSVIDTTKPAPSHEQLEGWGKGQGFGKLYGEARRNLPRPAIDSVTIDNKGALGSIRSASIRGVIYSETDLDWFEKLYMMPGVHLLLQWGWSTWEGNNIAIKESSNPDSIQRDIISKTLMSNDFHMIDKKARAQGGTIDDVGSYDAMLGVITSFNWSNTANGYSFDIKIISPNSVMNAMSLSSNNYGASIVKETTISDVEFNENVAKAGGNSDRPARRNTATTHNVTPLDDIEAILTHLAYMGNAFSSTSKYESYTKDEDGELEEVNTYTASSREGQASATESVNKKKALAGEQTHWGSGIDVQKFTDTTSNMEWSGQPPQFYTFGKTSYTSTSVGQEGSIPYFAKDESGNIQAFKHRVYNNVPFDPDIQAGDWKNYRTDDTFIRWTFFEKIISDSMPKNDQGKPLVKVKSTSADNAGVYHANSLFSHPNIFSCNHSVCLLAHNSHPRQAGFTELEDGYFTTLPAWNSADLWDNMPNALHDRETFESSVKPFVKTGEKNVGSFDGIWVNVNYLLKTYRQNKTSFNKFIMSALDGVNNACGKPWDFTIQNNSNDPTKIAIVDLNYTPNRDKFFGDQGTTYKFKSKMGILKDLRLTSKLPKGVQAKAYTAASSVNSGEYEGSDVFSLYTSGKTPIYDALTSNKKRTPQEQKKDEANKKNEENKKAAESDDSGDEKGYTKNPKYDMLLSAFKSLWFGMELSMAENKLRDYTEKIIFQNTKDNDFVPAIPIEASFKIDGLSGIYQGNGWELDTQDEGGLLPNRYKDKVAFQTTGVTHTINQRGWDTEIKGLMRAVAKKKRVYDEYTPPAAKYNTAVKTTTVNATPGENGPTSNKSPDALHPIVREAWFKVKADLEKQGWQPMIVTAFRSLTDQAEKVAKGRSQVSFGNHGAISAEGERASQALDVVDKRYSYGNSPSSISQIGKPATKDRAFLFWGAMGKIAKTHGFTWGGNYSHKGNAYTFEGKPGPPHQMGWDPGHIEMFGKNGTPSTRENLKNATTALGRTITSKGQNVV